ncbi:MAG: plastocyanin/azurin family copper-binding protein [Candidatus Velthaea sp.]|jgi:plastocyanin
MNSLHISLAAGMLGASVVGLSACTDGAPGAMSASVAGVTTIDVSLTAFAATSLAPGTSAGYAPAQLSVPVGTQIRFVNQDSFAHTASAVAGTTFPASSPLTAQALTPSASGTSIASGTWSSGNLAAGASSPVFVADRPGTYLFGCFYHYGAPMRAAILVH